MSDHEEYHENERLDIQDQLDDYEIKAQAGGKRVSFDLMKRCSNDGWIDIHHPTRLPSEEYIYLTSTGRMHIAKENLPGRIYYSTGVWIPLEECTHYRELPELPRKEEQS